MTTPAVAAIKRALPQASLTYVIEEPFRRLVEGNPHIDRVLTIPAKQSAIEFARFIRELRRETYDAVVDFHGGPRASRIAWLSRGKFKVGYRLKYKGWIYDVRVPRTRAGEHIHSVENHLNLVRALGVEVGETAPPLCLPEARKEEKERIEKIWKDNKLGGARAVVLHIGAGNQFRDWGEENLAALAGRLASTPGARVVLVGADRDRARAERIVTKGSAAITADGAAPIVSLAGKINLIELREVILRASLFVGPDSGPMHIAATTPTPIIAVFGPTLPAHFAPWQAEATILAKDLDCRPCKQRECVTSDFRCLRTITVDEVFAACYRGV